MSNAFTDRLREASLQFEDEAIQKLQGSVEEVAAAKPTKEDLLARLRLAFHLPVADEHVQAFRAQLNATNTVVADRGQDQLIAVLGACALIERFSSFDGLRAKSAIPAVTSAALASRCLSRVGTAAVHPDLMSWATYWLAQQGANVRRGSLTGLPQVPKAPGAEPQDVPTLAAQVEELRQHAGELRVGLERSAGAARIRALTEQNEILWWLLQEQDGVDPLEAAVDIAVQLSEISLLTPPPPAAEAFARRKLGELATTEVDLGGLRDAIAASGLPSGLANACPDLTPLMYGAVVFEGGATAGTVAHGLFEEITLARLSTEMAV